MWLWHDKVCLHFGGEFTYYMKENHQEKFMGKVDSFIRPTRSLDWNSFHFIIQAYTRSNVYYNVHLKRGQQLVECVIEDVQRIDPGSTNASRCGYFRNKMLLAVTFWVGTMKDNLKLALYSLLEYIWAYIDKGVESTCYLYEIFPQNDYTTPSSSFISPRGSSLHTNPSKPMSMLYTTGFNILRTLYFFYKWLFWAFRTITRLSTICFLNIIKRRSCVFETESFLWAAYWSCVCHLSYANVLRNQNIWRNVGVMPFIHKVLQHFAASLN